MLAVILVYDGVEAIEALGPFVTLSRAGGIDARFVASVPGPHRAHEPPLVLDAGLPLDAVTEPDVLVVPGGFGVHQLIDDAQLTAWLRQAHAAASITAGISTGSLLLAAAGVLEGAEATTHWLTAEELRAYGARPQPARLVAGDRVVTAMGGSAAIELGVLLVRRVAGDVEAERVAASVALDPDAFRPARANALHATMRRWATGAGGGPGAEGGAPRGRRGRRHPGVARSPRKIVLPPSPDGSWTS